MKRCLQILMLTIAAAHPSTGLAAEQIAGKILKIGDGAITVQTASDFVPNPGDQVRIGLQLSGLDDLDLVALGTVTKVGEVVEVKIIATFDKIKAFHKAQILSENPTRRQAAGKSSGSKDEGNTVTIRVPANAAWTKTGLVVREGDSLEFSASGTVEATPNTDKRPFYHQVPPSGRGDQFPYMPAPKLPALALVGRIGDGPAFLVGESLRLKVGPVKGDGELRLGINDDIVRDNEGQWLVRIKIAGASRSGK